MSIKEEILSRKRKHSQLEKTPANHAVKQEFVKLKIPGRMPTCAEFSIDRSSEWQPGFVFHDVRKINDRNPPDFILRYRTLTDMEFFFEIYDEFHGFFDNCLTEYITEQLRTILHSRFIDIWPELSGLAIYKLQRLMLYDYIYTFHKEYLRDLKLSLELDRYVNYLTPNYSVQNSSGNITVIKIRDDPDYNLYCKYEERVLVEYGNGYMLHAEKTHMIIVRWFCHLELHEKKFFYLIKQPSYSYDDAYERARCFFNSLFKLV